MHLTAQIGEESYRIDAKSAVHISIELNFGRAQPGAFGAPPAESQPYRAGTFVGSIAEGGSCQCECYSLIPHCNGTHTECVRHILECSLSVGDCLDHPLYLTKLISLEPTPLDQTDETGAINAEPQDLVISGTLLEHHLEHFKSSGCQALVVRTLPNPEKKRTTNYLSPPSYFTVEAASLLHSAGVQHLILDLPSIDRLEDEGQLLAHKAYWNTAALASSSKQTLTEFAYIPQSVLDDIYLLQISVPHFASDAAPSRLLLFPIEPTRTR